MLFRKSLKHTHNPCSCCGKENQKTKSEIIMIELNVFTKIITICESCQGKNFLSAEFDIKNLEDIKLSEN